MPTRKGKKVEEDFEVYGRSSSVFLTCVTVFSTLLLLYC